MGVIGIDFLIYIYIYHTPDHVYTKKISRHVASQATDADVATDDAAAQ